MSGSAYWSIQDTGGVFLPKAETYVCPKQHCWKGAFRFAVYVDGQSWETGSICPRCLVDSFKANFPATLVEAPMSESNVPVESEPMPTVDVPMEDPPAPAPEEKPPEEPTP